jgi:hypothetical protein
MADEQTTQAAEQSSPTSNETWQEVGQQFRALGESLATAVRAALENEETRRHMQELQTGLKAMINEVDQAVRDVAASPEGQRVRTEVEKAAQAARTTGKQAFQEAQPHLVSALRQVTSELQKLISRLEEPEPPTIEGTAEDRGAVEE